jgi:hypothetical protein
VDGIVLPRRDKSEVLFTVVSPVPVTVVNVIFDGDPVSDNSMFVGLDIRAYTDLPSESDVPVSGQVAASRTVRYLLAAKKLTDGASAAATLTTPRAKPFLGSSGDFDSTVDAGFPHGAILQVKTLCHRHFGGVTAFDDHRSNGMCVDPGSILRDGEPMYVQMEGIWRRPMEQEKVEAFRARVAGTRGRKREELD